MKGTRPRSKEKKIDVQLRNELQKSIKDKAEHLMIVDLIRNDLGKISNFGDRKLPEASGYGYYMIQILVLGLLIGMDITLSNLL